MIYLLLAGTEHVRSSEIAFTEVRHDHPKPLGRQQVRS